jgi:thiamine biosynthesis lipoprotein
MIQPITPSSDAELLARVRGSARHHAWGERWELTCQAMSTSVRIVFYTPYPGLAGEFQDVALDWIARFEARYSRFRPESIVGQINAHAGGEWIEYDEEAEQLFDVCDRMHALSGGIFDPATLPMLWLWNWKADPPVVPTPSSIEAARALCGWEEVQRRPRAIRLPQAGMGIDLGGIGKEYAVDHLVEMARQRGIANVMVDIGQDLRVSGHPPERDAWYIGLEEPDRPGECWTALRLTDGAVATSGDYLRGFDHEGRRYGHILDPRTGMPVANSCQAASVIASSCVLAGVLSTAAFIVGPAEGIDLIQQHGGAQGCITTDRARHQTRRFSSHVPT